VTDNRMKDRVKVMLGTSPDGATSEHALVSPTPVPGLPNQALQVLTMAQRTAEEHVATAHQQADKIRTDALAAAENIARDAQIHAHNVRREADKVLYDARAGADQIGQEAQAAAAEARRTAEKIVLDAQARADSIAAEAKANAEQLNLQAQQRYDDVVGSLGVKREALQEQIEALEQFDREYRGRLMTFMQGQLRALWVDQPQVVGDLPAVDDWAGRHGSTKVEAVVPAQRPPAEDAVEGEQEAAEGGDDAGDEPAPNER
jgi:cell division septum initiation protein DivIVA